MTDKQKRTVKKKGLPAGGVEVTPVMPVQLGIPQYYVNYIEVSQSPFEFAITGGRAPARLTESQLKEVTDKNQLPVEPLVQLLVPREVIDGLIAALQNQRDKYAERKANISEQ